MKRFPLPLSLNLIFCLYIYNKGFIPDVQNHVPDDIKIYQFRGAVIELRPHIADGSTTLYA